MTISLDISAGTGDGLGRFTDLRGESVCYDPVEQEYDFVIIGLRFNSSSTYPNDASMVGCDTQSLTRIVVANDMVYFLMKLPEFIGQSATLNWNGLWSMTVQLDFASLTADSTSMAIVVYDNADWDLFNTGAPMSDGDKVADDNTEFTGCEIG